MWTEQIAFGISSGEVQYRWSAQVIVWWELKTCAQWGVIWLSDSVCGVHLWAGKGKVAASEAKVSESVGVASFIFRNSSLPIGVEGSVGLPGVVDLGQ